MPTPTAEVRLPSFVTEDYIALLRATLAMAWAGVAGMLGVEVWLRLCGAPWPDVGGFSATYNLVLAEFALTAACLSVLVVWRAWFERVPREAIARLRTLLTVVVFWLGVHEFAMFHETGGASGPLLALLPVLVTAAFLALPAPGAWATAAFLVAGHVAVLAMENNGLLSRPGLLAPAFALGSMLGTLTLGVSLAFAILLGCLARGRMDDAGVNLNRSSRHSPLTGLYEHEFLMERLGSELARQRRHGTPLTFMLFELEGFPEFTAARGHDESRRVLRRVAQVLIASTRVKMDTPAHYAPTTLALLLPEASAEHLQAVLRRIEDALTQTAGGALRLRIGALSFAPKAESTPASVIAATVEALKAGTLHTI